MATTEYDVIFDKLAEDAFPILDALRESGLKNMWDSPQMLIDDMNVDRDTARKLVSAWMHQVKNEEDKNDVDS